jgi:hypothetical protein
MTERDLVPQDNRLQLLQKFMGLSEDESRRLVDLITQKTPKDWIMNRTIKGGGTASYIAGYHFVERFNDAFGMLWSFEVPETFVEEGNKRIIAKGRWSLQVPGRTITRRHPDGAEETIRFDGFSIIKEQFGSAEIKKWSQDVPARDKKGNQLKDPKNGSPLFNYRRGDLLDLGNDYKAAATDAMKKCGLSIGFFQDIYGARESIEEAGPTESQLGAFYLRAGKCNMDRTQADAWALAQLEKPLAEASQQEILGLVADLIDLAKEKK